MKVVVVDDDPINVKTVVEGLQEEGFEVFQANGAMEAIEIIEKTPGIEWVVTDMVMPEVDGDQLITMLSEEKYQSIDIIAMTGQSLGLLTKTFAKHKKKKKVFPVLKPVKIELITKLMKKKSA